jgi:hypothetical protein
MSCRTGRMFPHTTKVVEFVVSESLPAYSVDAYPASFNADKMLPLL